MQLMPPPVRLLDQDVIHRIAAGEVVDRPASVLKELLDNAVDAKATKINIVLQNGGLDKIEVEDDGWGMSRKDLEASLQRHATSKISSLDDLDKIFSLGFRGEALSAISSVARLQIDTFSKDDASWTLKYSADVEEPMIEPGLRQLGTKLSVHELFYNVPARKKFLKSAGREAKLCVEVVEDMALAHPSVEFQAHIIDAAGEVKEQIFFAKATGSQRFVDFISRYFSEKQNYINESLLSVENNDYQNKGIKSLKVHLLKAPFAHRTQRFIRLLVNGRPVQDRALAYSIREAYSGLIEIGHFPLAIVDLQVDPAIVDVNVHPQKKELRWPKDFSLAGIVYRVIRPLFEIKSHHVSSQKDEPSFFTKEIPQEQKIDLGVYQSLASNMPSALASSEAAAQNLDSSRAPVFLNRESPLPDRDFVPNFKFSSLRVLGELGAAWLLAEAEEGMILIDQHAAHERINYERMMTLDHFEAKALLLPLEIKLPHYVQELKSQIQEHLERLGFEADRSDLRQDFICFIAAPETKRKINWKEYFEVLFDKLSKDESVEGAVAELKNKIAASLACHGSIRRGRRMAQDEISELFKQMDQVKWGAFCPHGRPVFFLISHQEIEKRFHRS